MLAGRALKKEFFPLTGSELNRLFNLEKALTFGLLPQIWSEKYNEAESIEYLYSYVENYIKEEIQQEAITRNLPAYSDFLYHMALRNSQVINLQNLSQEIGVARTTLKNYLEILEDTLLGCVLRPIELKAKVKEVATPKFYFFDTGVVRILAQRANEPLSTCYGSQLETYVLHEINYFSKYNSKHWEFYYWATPSENEVDFIVCSGSKKIGIEVKSNKKWTKDFNKGLNLLLDNAKISHAYGVYGGDDIIKVENTLVIPAKIFSTFIHKNDLFSI